MDTIKPEGRERIGKYSDAELDADLDRSHPVADPAERLAVLEEKHIRNKTKHADDQKTQKDIKRIAAWTLAVGIVVLVVTLIQLFK